MSQRASVTEVVRNFADYVNRVVYRGERFTLTRADRPVAELGPVPAAKRLGDLPAILRGVPRLTPSEAEAFAGELAAAREQLGKGSVRDPWES